MTLRTPRRRISPRTKLRYRAVREFFRRALGNTSHHEININSSIAVNVTDLKRKIIGLEQQLDEVGQHCRNFASLENCSKRASECSLQSDLKLEIDNIKEHTKVSAERELNDIETQLIYKKSSECNGKKSDKSEDNNFITKSHNDNDVIENETTMTMYDGQVTKVKNNKNKRQKISNAHSKLHKHKARPIYDNFTAVYSTTSFHSLKSPRMNHSEAVYPCHSDQRKQIKEEKYLTEINPHHHKDKKHKHNFKNNMGDQIRIPYDDKPVRYRKNKRHKRDLDTEFIADIIRRQYKPVKLFGRRESDFLSQFSAPVCRDQEFSLKENIQEDPELCSCFFRSGYRSPKHRYQDLNAMQSFCDARLYNSKKYLRPKFHKMPADAYSNSDMYDLVPVKERSSPKARRKVVENDKIPYDNYREVPPSPRTLRPRLNLKAQYCTELEDRMARTKHQVRKRSPKRQTHYQESMEAESDIMSEVMPVIAERQQQPRKYMQVPVEENQVQEQCQPDADIMSNLQYPQHINENTNILVDATLNKTQETDIANDKTDKALCEIKDILQSFLHEIKKDTTVTQCGQFDIGQECKPQDNDSNMVQDLNNKTNSNIGPNATNFNNYSVGQCNTTPFLTPFANPCCYPIMPLCPVNCPMPVPNGYVMPSQSFTCTDCINAAKESNSAHCCNKNIDATCPTKTDELIKEIYNFVAQGKRRNSVGDNIDAKREIKKVDNKILTSRSAGGSCKYFQQDANVGTQPLRCYSKSCEALGSRFISDAYYSRTNASYSDILLEKLSTEATTNSTSETELETETTDPNKVKRVNRFSKVLRSFGIIKKKKKDVIEELSESESVIDVEVKPKKAPFRQDITNYMMHGQEYYHSPPVEPLYQRHKAYQTRSHNYQHRTNNSPQRPHEYRQRPRKNQPHSHEYQSQPYEYEAEYHPPYNPGARGDRSPQPHDPYGQRYQTHMREHYNMPPHVLKQRPTAPPLYNSSYDSNYSQMQPPLCLKEIEVKSTGTQSERKMSMFKKLSMKLQQPARMTAMAAGDEYHRSFSTQTPQAPQAPLVTKKPTSNMTKPLFNWKSLQAKAMQGMQNTDPMAYSLKTQKELAAGDLKLRNAMLKKMFYKRNPFSPRNLIVRTLLGKDKSSYGEPTNIYRPRMFI